MTTFPDFEIREAGTHDAPGMLEIYAPIVRTTAISFEAHPPSVREFRDRIQIGLTRHPWLVACQEERVLGYAYASPFRGREAYRATAEVTIYTSPTGHRRGLGRTLYEQLLRCLTQCHIHTAVAAVARPNAPSESFHLALGFEPAGVIPKAGYKHDTWHDVAFFTLQLQQDDSFREPILWSELPEPRL